jgi:SAM-dependent methyltransferase
MATHEDSPLSAKHDFVQLLAAFRSSAVLFAALELDVFSQIPEEGAWPEQLELGTGVETTRLRLLLNGLTALGLLEQQGGRVLVPRQYAVLLRRGPSSFVSYLLAQKREAENLLHLATTLQGGEAGPWFADELRHSEQAWPYLAYIEETTATWVGHLVDRLRPFVDKARRVLCIGGSHGTALRQLLDLNPSLEVTLLDLKPAVAYCLARLADTPYAQRLAFVAGDPRTQEVPQQFDLVLIDNVLHYYSWEGKREIVRNGWQSLLPGGRLAMVKLRLEANGIEPPETSLFSLKILAISGHGYQETDAESIALLGHVLARDIQLIHLTAHHSLVTGLQ